MCANTALRSYIPQVDFIHQAPPKMDIRSCRMTRYCKRLQPFCLLLAVHELGTALDGPTGGLFKTGCSGDRNSKLRKEIFLLQGIEDRQCKGWERLTMSSSYKIKLPDVNRLLYVKSASRTIDDGWSCGRIWETANDLAVSFVGNHALTLPKRQHRSVVEMTTWHRCNWTLGIHEFGIQSSHFVAIPKSWSMANTFHQ